MQCHLQSLQDGVFSKAHDGRPTRNQLRRWQAHLFSEIGPPSHFRIRALLPLLEYGEILTFKLPAIGALFPMVFLIAVL